MSTTVLRVSRSFIYDSAEEDSVVAKGVVQAAQQYYEVGVKNKDVVPT